MSKIVKFKLILERFLGEYIGYEIDAKTAKEKYAKILNNKVINEEYQLEHEKFLNKMCVIEKNTKELNDVYIEESILDGLEAKMLIEYDDGTERNIICKNKIPKGVNEILEIIEKN